MCTALDQIWDSNIPHTTAGELHQVCTVNSEKKMQLLTAFSGICGYPKSQDKMSD